MPTCWIIAGPNGAGKTTFALEYLPQVAQCSRFINADLIAAGLSPLAPERELLAASRLFLGEVDAAIAKRENFAFETTLAGRVTHGGHNIPTADIERRFARSLANLLDVFSVEVDACRCFMNSASTPELVFEQQGALRNVVAPQHFSHLQAEARP